MKSHGSDSGLEELEKFGRSRRGFQGLRPLSMKSDIGAFSQQDLIKIT